MAESFQHPVDIAAQSIRAWAFSDSSVNVEAAALRRALHSDSETAGRLPTEQECQTLVCGNDDGEIPLSLKQAFPKTHALLEEYW